MSVELHCVQENKKVRVKIAAYINNDGKRYNNVYDNTFNCRFPRNLRVAGRKFQVPAENVKLNHTPGKAAFYIVSAKNITTLSDDTKDIDKKDETVSVEHVWETSIECVICLSEDSEMIFTPCGHKCSCKKCGNKLKNCCICRSSIKSMITIEEYNKSIETKK